MGRVLSAITSDDFVNAVVTSEREVDLDDVVAGLHETQNSLHLFTFLFERGALLHVFDERVLDDLAPTVKEIFDL